MELKEAIRNRRSTRDFSDTMIPASVINEILDFANRAPSAGNLQAREFIIVDDEFQREQLSIAANDQTFIAEAPVIIIVCANLKRISSYGKRGRELYCIQDASAAVEHILLLAVDYGLGTCWVGAFDEQAVSTLLELPSYIRPVALVPLGYAKKPSASRTKRMETNLLTHHDRW
jgi:nitroreductase